MKAKGQGKEKGLRGAGVLAIGFGLLVMLIIVFVFLDRFSKSDAVMSYEECVKAKGSSILTSYPSVCLTRDKKSFVNPAEQRP